MSRSLSAGLRYYFADYLVRCRGVRPNTLASYQDAMGLFVQFLKKQLRKASSRKIRIECIRPQHVLDFLDHLEDTRDGRSNAPATRNLRLAAIKGFFAATALWDPHHGPLAERMRLIPSKRAQRHDPDYLDLHELQEVFRTIDTTKADGLRDAAIFLFMINSGARASEVAGARLSLATLDGSFRHVRIVGKGNRERVCPLWEETVALLKHYVASFRRRPRPEDFDVLFVNRRGHALTRSGVLKLVKKYAGRAAEKLPSLKRKRIRAHTIRHSTGVLLLRSGVDLSVIRSWLGHVRLDTTAHYARLTALDKRQALDQFFTLGKLFLRDAALAEQQHDQELLHWLASL